MSVFTAYLNDNAQTPLDQFVVYMLYKQVGNKHGDKSNKWSLCLSLSQLERPPSEVWYSVAIVQDTVDRKSPSAVETLF